LATLTSTRTHNTHTHTAVMLNAASAMDAAILVVAANEECPRPQTAEHLAAADLMNLGRYVVIQNKVDLVSEEDARKSYLDIRGFTQSTGAEVIYLN